VRNYIKYLLIFLMGNFLAACNPEVLEQKGPRDPSFQITENSHTVLFIHGMYLTPIVWNEWENYFQDLGYTTFSPAWPLHDLSVEELNNLHPRAELGALTLSEVVDHYRKIIAGLDEKPIVVGHSMGGLITQKLLQEGLIAAGIVIDSAPPQGVISAEPNFLQANWPHLNPLLSISEPTRMTPSEFGFAFTNGMSPAEQEAAYNNYAVPESRRIGRAPITPEAAIDDIAARAPLLIIASGQDNIVTASLNYLNFIKYRNTPAITDFKQFPDRNHWTITAAGWGAVADYVQNWIIETKKPLTPASATHRPRDPAHHLASVLNLTDDPASVVP